MLINGKTERNLGKIPHAQLVEWATAIDRAAKNEKDRKCIEVIREIQRYLWNVIQSGRGSES